jgi:hypothetical protein
MNAVLYMHNCYEKLFIIKNPDPPFVPWIAHAKCIRMGKLKKTAKKASWDLEKIFLKIEDQVAIGYCSSRYLLYFVFACHLFAFMHTGRPKVVHV